MFQIDKTVMLLVDVQGRLAQLMYEKDKLFESLGILIQGMNVLEIPIVWLEQIPRKLGPTTEVVAQYMTGNMPIEKFTFSSCNEPNFMEAFNEIGRKQVLLTGIETHICVFQTAHDLINKHGCDVQVVTDCVSSRTKENKDIGIQRIVQAGAVAGSVEMALFELLKAARGDQFKKIIPLIK